MKIQNISDQFSSQYSLSLVSTQKIVPDMRLVFSVLIVAALGITQINGEENEWLKTAKNVQNSIMDSVAKVKSYGINEEKVKSVTDDAFDRFVKHVKRLLSPTLVKLNTTSYKNTRINTKLNAWIEELDRINNASDSSLEKNENPFSKFENTIGKMVKNAPQFAEKIKSASSENSEILFEIGNLMKKIIETLANEMKDVENKLQNEKNVVLQKTK